MSLFPLRFISLHNLTQVLMKFNIKKFQTEQEKTQSKQKGKAYKLYVFLLNRTNSHGG